MRQKGKSVKGMKHEKAPGEDHRPIRKIMSLFLKCRKTFVSKYIRYETVQVILTACTITHFFASAS